MSAMTEERWRQAREWQCSGDTGASSQTMMSAAIGEDPPRADRGRGCYPLDPDDLGRCVRLIERVPWVTGAFRPCVAAIRYGAE